MGSSLLKGPYFVVYTKYRTMILPAVVCHPAFTELVYTKSFSSGDKTYVVTLGLCEECSETKRFSIGFIVNGDYDFCSDAPKIAITKWLLRVFRHVCTYASSLEACSWYDDDMGSYRNRLFQKLGFTLDCDFLFLEL